jgi:hypothetical protein
MARSRFAICDEDESGRKYADDRLKVACFVRVRVFVLPKGGQHCQLFIGHSIEGAIDIVGIGG